MDRFTHEVMNTGGVLIDYFGDGLAAFWNAPLPQPDHALLACQAALKMCAALPEISDDWYPITGRHLRLGIGIHTATTLVGNAGSRSRIKYGPRGSAMNLASRVQTATKQLGLPVLITRATAQQLAGKLATRRVAQVRLDGFADPVDLYQPLASDQLDLLAHQGTLDDALIALAEGQEERAGELARKLQAAGANDPAVDHLTRLLR
jgi:adenylate cyclase